MGETKAVAAEKLIELLKQQISQVKAAQSGKSSVGGAAFNEEIIKLKDENAKLKSEVEIWKSKLTAAEVANGKKMYTPNNSENKEVSEKKKSDDANVAPPEKEKKIKAEKQSKPPKERKEVKKDHELPVDIGRLICV